MQYDNKNYKQGWQSHQKHFAIFVAQAKSDAIISEPMDSIFLMRYYRSSFAIIF